MDNEKVMIAPDTAGVEIFTPEEVEKMVAAVQPFNIYHLCIMLSLFTGVTRAELNGIQWGDIDAENKLLKIRRTGNTRLIERGRDIKECITTELKNERQARDLPIPDRIAKQMTIMKDSHSDDQLILEEPFEVIRAAKLRLRYETFLKKSGVRYKSISALRHTFAVTCIENGMMPEELSRLLGHKDVYVTYKRYGALIRKGVRRNDD